MRLRTIELFTIFLLATNIAYSEDRDYCGHDNRDDGFELIVMNSLMNMFNNGPDSVLSSDLMERVSSEAKECGIPDLTDFEKKLMYEKALIKWYEINEEREAFPDWVQEYRIRGGDPELLRQQIWKDQALIQAHNQDPVVHLPILRPLPGAVPTPKIPARCSGDRFKAFVKEQMQARVASITLHAYMSDVVSGCHFIVTISAGVQGRLKASISHATWIFPTVMVPYLPLARETSLQQLIQKLPVFR